MTGASPLSVQDLEDQVVELFGGYEALVEPVCQLTFPQHMGRWQPPVRMLCGP
jgi:hypothetical protein